MQSSFTKNLSEIKQYEQKEKEQIQAAVNYRERLIRSAREKGRARD